MGIQIADEVLDHTKKQFQQLDHDVELIVFTTTNHCLFCNELEELVTKVAELSPKIKIKQCVCEVDSPEAKKYNIDDRGTKKEILTRVLKYQNKHNVNILGKRKRNTKQSRKCYNPYAICSKSTKRVGLIKCFDNTNLKGLPKNELIALGKLKGKKL